MQWRQTVDFRVHALSAAGFQHLFALSDAELRALEARREIVKSKPGAPCRISLEDAEVGEEVILLHYEHQRESSPYRASHAIYVRRGVQQAKPAVNEIPALFAKRLMSVRAFDSSHSMIDADVVPGTELQHAIRTMFHNHAVAYIHLHNAKPGCYAARVTRA